MAVKVEFEIGHTSKLRAKKTPDGFTHDWDLYVEGVNKTDISSFVDKVVFNLHDSFPKPKRTCKEPPYLITESGYAGFSLDIDIYFRNRDEPKRVTFNYDLDLQKAGPPRHHYEKKSYIFHSPSEEFRAKLLKGGGVPMTGVINNDLSIPASSSAISGSDDGMVNKPKLGCGDGIGGKKHKIRTDDTKRSTFAHLFGPPITKSVSGGNKNSPDNKNIGGTINGSEIGTKVAGGPYPNMNESGLNMNPSGLIKDGKGKDRDKSSPTNGNGNIEKSKDKSEKRDKLKVPSPQKEAKTGDSKKAIENSKYEKRSEDKSKKDKNREKDHVRDRDRDHRERDRERDKSSKRIGNSRPNSPKHSSPAGPMDGNKTPVKIRPDVESKGKDMKDSKSKEQRSNSSSSGRKSKKQKKEKSRDKDRERERERERERDRDKDKSGNSVRRQLSPKLSLTQDVNPNSPKRSAISPPEASEKDKHRSEIETKTASNGSSSSHGNIGAVGTNPEAKDIKNVQSHNAYMKKSDKETKGEINKSEMKMIDKEVDGKKGLQGSGSVPSVDNTKKSHKHKKKDKDKKEKDKIKEKERKEKGQKPNDKIFESMPSETKKTIVGHVLEGSTNASNNSNVASNNNNNNNNNTTPFASTKKQQNKESKKSKEKITNKEDKRSRESEKLRVKTNLSAISPSGNLELSDGDSLLDAPKTTITNAIVHHSDSSSSSFPDLPGKSGQLLPPLPASPSKKQDSLNAKDNAKSTTANSQREQKQQQQRTATEKPGKSSTAGNEKMINTDKENKGDKDGKKRRRASPPSATQTANAFVEPPAKQIRKELVRTVRDSSKSPLLRSSSGRTNRKNLVGDGSNTSSSFLQPPPNATATSASSTVSPSPSSSNQAIHSNSSPALSNGGVINNNNNNNSYDEENPSKLPTEYLTQLQDLQQKIMTLQDNDELQQVVEIIAATGCYEITSKTFDFDLCRLDRNTVHRLQEFFEIAVP